MANATITTVLFDIGGVFVEDTVDSGLELIGERYGASDGQVRDFRRRHRRSVDAGDLTERQFWEGLIRELSTGSKASSPADLDDAFDIEGLIDPIAGTVRILDAVIAAGLKTAVLSNDSSSLARAKLARCGIEGNFANIVISAEVGAVKPDPEIYRIACEGVSEAPERCLFIDDNEPNLVTARDLGMATVLFESPPALAVRLAELLDRPELDSFSQTAPANGE